MGSTPEDQNLHTEANATADQDGRPIALAFALICGLFVIYALRYWVLIDDAFISFRYAHNLINGSGLVFNPGERVEGYSNLLWTLLMAAGMAVGAPPEVLSRLIALASALAVLWFTWHVCRRLLPDDRISRWVSLLPVVLLASNRSFAAWTGGGLETRFFTMLLMAGLYLSLGRDNCRGSRWVALPLALMVLTRVDGVMYAGILAAGAWLHATDVPLARKAFPLATVVSTFTAQTAFRLLYYGDLLPNTFYVKVGGVPLQMGIDYLWSAFVGQGLGLMLALGLFVFLPGTSRSLTAGHLLGPDRHPRRLYSGNRRRPFRVPLPRCDLAAGRDPGHRRLAGAGRGRARRSPSRRDHRSGAHTPELERCRRLDRLRPPPSHGCQHRVRGGHLQKLGNDRELVRP